MQARPLHATLHGRAESESELEPDAYAVAALQLPRPAELHEPDSDRVPEPLSEPDVYSRLSRRAVQQSDAGRGRARGRGHVGAVGGASAVPGDRRRRPVGGAGGEPGLTGSPGWLIRVCRMARQPTT